MKKKWTTRVFIILFICVLFLPNGAQEAIKGTDKDPAINKNKREKIIDAEFFVRNFIKAMEANDQTKMEELVKQAEPIVGSVVILAAQEAIRRLVIGIDASLYLSISKIMAELYVKEFKKEGLVELVRKYSLYDLDMCEEKLRGDELLDEGLSLYRKGQWKGAISKWTEAEKIFDKLGDEAGKASAFNNLGNFYDSTGEYREALEYFKQALEIFKRLGFVEGEAKNLNNVGVVYRHLGQYAEALNYFQRALETYRRLGFESGEAMTLPNIGLVYDNLGQYDEALDYHQQALEKFRKIGDVSSEARTLANIGGVFESLGQYKEALNYYEKALEKFRRIEDVPGETYTIANMANVYSHLGQYSEALNSYQQILEILREMGDAAGESTALINMGLVYFRLGQYNEALSYYQQSLEICREIGGVVGEARALNNIGLVYCSLGQDREGLSYHQQSLEIYRKIGGVAGEANALNNIGIVHWSLGQYSEALNYYGQALEISRNIGNAASVADCLNNIGIIYTNLSQYPKAIQTLHESIYISSQLGVLETMWRCFISLCRALWKSGKGEEAASSFEKAIETIEKIYSHTSGLKEEERSSMIGEKRFVYQEFIELLLELHRKSPDMGYDKQAFTISEKAKSRTFQELMAKAGARAVFAGDETFQKIVEKERQLIAKAIHFQGLLSKEMSKPEEKRNIEMVNSLKEQLSKAEKSLSEAEKKIETEYPRYADLKRPKSLSVEELQDILKPDETLLTYAVGKDKSAAFVIGKERFKLVELAVGREELAEMITKLRGGLDAELIKLRKKSEGRDPVFELKDLEKFKPEDSYTLCQKVFLPVSEELEGATRLYISADDILYTLPFEALVDSEFDINAFREARKLGRRGQGDYLGEYAALHYLIDTYTLTYLPSASVFRSLRKYEKSGYGKWGKPLIAFADPIFSKDDVKTEEEKGLKDKGIKQKGISKETELTAQILTRSTGSGELKRLEESAQEAEVIAEEVKGDKEDVYLREKATEENIHAAGLKSARYLLFSTHGLLGGDFTGVAEPALALTLVNNPLTRDGFLTMSEVLGLDINSELVILSACNTYGRGEKAGRGEGFAGLTRSFMYAGTRSLLVTHWSVESQAARDLMVETFKKMKKEASSKALREAKLEMRKSFRHLGEKTGRKLSLSHPFFWAPFVLVGEGK